MLRFVQPPKNAGVVLARGHATISSDNKKWGTYYLTLNADATLQIFQAVQDSGAATASGGSSLTGMASGVGTGTIRSKGTFPALGGSTKANKMVDLASFSRGTVRYISCSLEIFIHSRSVLGCGCPHQRVPIYFLGQEEATYSFLLHS